MGLIISFLFGLIWGSFLNVVIYRYDDWRAIVFKSSHCRDCQQQLRWYDLIPLLSYLSLRGKCRYCQQPIAWQYPIVELTTGFLILAGYYLIFIAQQFELYRSVFAIVSFIIAIGAMIVIFFHDLREMMVPEEVSYVLLFSCLIFGLFYSGSILTTLYGGLIGVLPIALLVYPSGGRWMGEGDVKIALALGLMLGYPLTIAFLAASFLLGGLFGSVALLVKAAKLKSAVPFAPFLIIGCLISLFWGPELINWYLRSFGYGY